VFPYVKPDLYNASAIPAFLKRKILGVPAITWPGAAATLHLLFSTYYAHATRGLTLNLKTILVNVANYGGGVLICAVGFYKAKGIPIEQVPHHMSAHISSYASLVRLAVVTHRSHKTTNPTNL
jgi:hypothetical protein